MKPAADRYSWWPLPAIILTGAAVLAAIWSGRLSLTGKPSVDGLATLISTELLLFVWLVAFSPLSSANRVKTIFLVFALETIPHLVACIEGFTGDGQPMLAWRWTPLPGSDLSGSLAHQEAPPADETISESDLTTSPATDYPGFRGRDRSATVDSVNLGSDWTDNPPQQVWRQPVGPGWSSFAIVGASCVTQEQRGEEEAVVCYDVATGRQRWQHLDQARFAEMMGGEGPRATPTIESGRVYALGATGLLNCLDGRNGEAIWSVNVLRDNGARNAAFGMCGSPLVFQSMVVVSPGGPGAAIVAYDRNTGRKLWSAGDSDAGYSSPQIASLGGREQILSFNAEGLFAHDPSTGRILWNYPWVTPPERNNVCQPIPLPAHDDLPDRVFISSGYGKGCTLLALDMAGESFQVRPIWTNKLLKSKFASAVVHSTVVNGDFVFGLDDGILTCVDLNSGAARWKQGRYGHGQLLLADDKLLVQAEKGDVVLVAASAERHQELGRFAALSQRTWNHPALAGNLLLVRNDREAACFRLPGR